MEHKRIKLSFADQQAALIASPVISNQSSQVVFDPNTTASQVGRAANTKSALDISNQSVKNTSTKRANKKALALSGAAKADAAREEGQAPISQVSLQQPSLFNLGF